MEFDEEDFQDYGPNPSNSHHHHQSHVEDPGVLSIWVEPERSWTWEIGLRISQFLVISGGILPYIPQYMEILRSKNHAGFSLYVCLAIVVSNTLRIAYWFGRHYDLAIFIQSIAMIIVMLVMLELCIRIQNRPRVERNFLDFEIQYFWKWSNILSYIQFIVVLNVLCVFIVFTFGWIPGVLQMVAITSLVVEAGIAIPQFVQNWIVHSTDGLNKAMVCLWTFGDLYKLIYYLFHHVPLPFTICTVFQLFLDLTILGQILIYGDWPREPLHFHIDDFPHN